MSASGLLRSQSSPPELLGKKGAKHHLPVYPADHQVGMEVPVGGSNCDKCEYLKAPQTCGNAKWVGWNGSNRIPVKTDRYCCDFFDD